MFLKESWIKLICEVYGCSHFALQDELLDGLTISNFGPVFFNILTCGFGKGFSSTYVAMMNEVSTNHSEIVKCTEYIYDNTFFDETLATKLNLVCDDERYRNLLGTLLIIALLFGSLIGGRLGDQFGRIKMFFGSIALTIPIVIGLGYVENYASKL